MKAGGSGPQRHEIPCLYGVPPPPATLCMLCYNCVVTPFNHHTQFSVPGES